VIKTHVDQATYDHLTELRVGNGFATISELFLEKCGVALADGVAGEIAREAIERAKQRPVGSPSFRLCDLFPDEEWAAYPIGARRVAGRVFRHRVNRLDGIELDKKSPENQQLYIRTAPFSQPAA
jgi:Domain of unknown function (DUF1413)